MIERNYQQKDVMLISDFPLENEIRRCSPYTEPSQTNLKDALNNASLNECKNDKQKYLLNSLSICYTYLSTERYEKGDFDWAKSIVSKKSIPEDQIYYQIPWLKDVWVSYELQQQIVELLEQIKKVNPKLIILAGKWSLFFLAVRSEEPEKQLATIASTKSKVTDKKWFGKLATYRSSILTLFNHFGLQDIIVMPILTPAYHFIIPDKQFVINRDYAKLARIYKKLCTGTETREFLTFQRKTLLGLANIEVFEYLDNLLNLLDKEKTLVSIDVETRHGCIDCIGLAYKENEGFTIPFSYMKEEINNDLVNIGYLKKNNVEQEIQIPIGAKIIKYYNYWSLQDELDIMTLLWKVMLHPNCLHVGQNYNYDCQYYYHEWNLNIHSHCDTMILNHVLYNYMEKNLAYLASIYCDDYTYWKDDLNIQDNTTRWVYNSKDVCYTLSVAKLLLQILELQTIKLKNFYYFQQFENSPVAVKMMNRGVRVHKEKKDVLNVQFSELMEGCIQKINYIFNEEVNLNSTPQVKRAFKDLLGIKPILNRKTKKETFGADAMLVYLDSYPEWRTLLTLFLEYKSIKVFVKTFLGSELDEDGRMRCSYNIAGTKTYRYASRKNVFGRGMNLANVPSHGKIDLTIALQELEFEDTDDN